VALGHVPSFGEASGRALTGLADVLRWIFDAAGTSIASLTSLLTARWLVICRFLSRSTRTARRGSFLPLWDD